MTKPDPQDAPPPFDLVALKTDMDAIQIVGGVADNGDYYTLKLNNAGSAYVLLREDQLQMIVEQLKEAVKEALKK